MRLAQPGQAEDEDAGVGDQVGPPEPGDRVAADGRTADAGSARAARPTMGEPGAGGEGLQAADLHGRAAELRGRARPGRRGRDRGRTSRAGPAGTGPGRRVGRRRRPACAVSAGVRLTGGSGPTLGSAECAGSMSPSGSDGRERRRPASRTSGAAAGARTPTACRPPRSASGSRSLVRDGRGDEDARSRRARRPSASSAAVGGRRRAAR